MTYIDSREAGRQLGLSAHPEVAVGAIGEHGIVIVDPDMIQRASWTLSTSAAETRASVSTDHPTHEEES